MSEESQYRCWCFNCNLDIRSPELSDPWLSVPYVLTRMIVCPTCGNKRCPHATDHNLECTGSNDPGQSGSRYA